MQNFINRISDSQTERFRTGYFNLNWERKICLILEKKK